MWAILHQRWWHGKLQRNPKLLATAVISLLIDLIFSAQQASNFFFSFCKISVKSIMQWVQTFSSLVQKSITFTLHGLSNNSKNQQRCQVGFFHKAILLMKILIFFIYQWIYKSFSTLTFLSKFIFSYLLQGVNKKLNPLLHKLTHF